MFCSFPALCTRHSLVTSALLQIVLTHPPPCCPFCLQMPTSLPSSSTMGRWTTLTCRDWGGSCPTWRKHSKVGKSVTKEVCLLAQKCGKYTDWNNYSVYLFIYFQHHWHELDPTASTYVHYITSNRDMSVGIYSVVTIERKNCWAAEVVQV